MNETKHEQQELGIDLPKPAPKPPPQKDGGSIGVVALDRMDFAALRKECGDCEDENGVSLWTILESLRGYGVKEVNLI